MITQIPAVFNKKKKFTSKELKQQNEGLQNLLFSNLKLINYDFTSADFRSSLIEASTFRNCVFSRADLDSCTFIETVFDSCEFNITAVNSSKFIRCSFIDTDGRLSVYNNCQFTDCKFENHDISETTINNCIFQDCKINKMKTKKGEIIHSQFINSNVVEIDFGESTSRYLNFINSVILNCEIDLKFIMLWTGISLDDLKRNKIYHYEVLIAVDEIVDHLKEMRSNLQKDGRITEYASVQAILGGYDILASNLTYYCQLLMSHKDYEGVRWLLMVFLDQKARASMNIETYNAIELMLKDEFTQIINVDKDIVLLNQYMRILQEFNKLKITLEGSYESDNEQELTIAKPCKLRLIYSGRVDLTKKIEDLKTLNYLLSADLNSISDIYCFNINQVYQGSLIIDVFTICGVATVIITLYRTALAAIGETVETIDKIQEHTSKANKNAITLNFPLKNELNESRNNSIKSLTSSQKKEIIMSDVNQVFTPLGKVQDVEKISSQMIKIINNSGKYFECLLEDDSRLSIIIEEKFTLVDSQSKHLLMS